MNEWLEKKYDEVFDSVYQLVCERKQNDPSFRIADLEQMLHTHYVVQGNDQDGRGGVGEVQNRASIDAMERLLHEWRRELAPIQN